MDKKRTRIKLYDSKIFWLILSLIAALFMWIYVAGQDTEEFKRTFPGVQVELVGEDILRESRNLVITDLDTSTVTVEIIGPRRIVGALSSDDLKARVDVSRLTQAAYTSQQYTVVFPDGIDTSGLQTTSRTPTVLNFMVSNLTKITIPVRGSFDGSLAEGYTAETPVFEPSTITVYGAEVYLKDVEYAWVSFGAEDVSQSYTVETGYTLMDKNGEACSTTGLSFSTDVITATLPIMAVKEVPLTVNIIYGAGATEETTKVTIEPASITLAGDSALLAGLNKITVATIDVGDFLYSFTDSYIIAYDDELMNLTGDTSVTVTVELIGLETRTFYVDNLSCINVTEGYDAEIITKDVLITVRGPAEQIRNVRAENIRAVADLMDYVNSVGTFMPEVKVYVDGSSDVAAYGGPYTITVELSRMEES